MPADIIQSLKILLVGKQMSSQKDYVRRMALGTMFVQQVMFVEIPQIFPSMTTPMRKWMTVGI